jgi:hypothetical protein
MPNATPATANPVRSQYEDIVRHLLAHGVQKADRTGTGPRRQQMWPDVRRLRDYRRFPAQDQSLSPKEKPPRRMREYFPAPTFRPTACFSGFPGFYTRAKFLHL